MKIVPSHKQGSLQHDMIGFVLWEETKFDIDHTEAYIYCLIITDTSNLNWKLNTEFLFFYRSVLYIFMFLSAELKLTFMCHRLSRL